MGSEIAFVGIGRSVRAFILQPVNDAFISEN